jgi:hypothetical protein
MTRSALFPLAAATALALSACGGATPDIQAGVASNPRYSDGAPSQTGVPAQQVEARDAVDGAARYRRRRGAVNCDRLTVKADEE